MVAVPGQVNGRIDYNGDTDSFSVWLTSGSSYDFDVIGHRNGDSGPLSPGLLDPTLTVTGHGQSRFDDDGGPGRNSHIDFTANSTGWYTLTVAGFSNEQGNYTLYTDNNVLEAVV